MPLIDGMGDGLSMLMLGMGLLIPGIEDMLGEDDADGGEEGDEEGDADGEEPEDFDEPQPATVRASTATVPTAATIWRRRVRERTELSM